MAQLLKYFGITAIFFAIFAVNAQADTWQDLKGDHFVVYYNFKEDLPNVQLLLRKAEEYYDRIARQIGYARYANFWTWDERVKIIVFPNQETFVRNTHQPAWSRGYAERDSELFHSRIIVTYRQEADFLEGLLPHEIGHLILHDFVGFSTFLPLWFDEGVAQLQEKDKKGLADQFIKPLAKQRSHVPFKLLMYWDIRKESDAQKVKIFYAQSVSIVDFMIKNYGSSAFGNFCRNLKEGKTMEEVLRSTYTGTIDSVENLEKRWVEYMSH